MDSATPPKDGVIDGPRQEMSQLKEELRQTRLELARERAKFSTLLSLMSEGLIFVDPKGHVLASNQRGQNFTGLSAEQLVYEVNRDFRVTQHADGGLQPSSEPVDPDELPLARALRGESVRDQELTFHIRDREVSFLANAGAIRDDEGKLYGALVTFQDITRRTWAESRTRLLNELTEMLAAGELGQTQFDQIAHMVGKVMGAWSVLALVQPNETDLRIVATYHPDEARADDLVQLAHQVQIEIGNDPGMGTVAATGRPVLRSKPPNFDRLKGMDPAVPGLFKRMGCESLLIVPLKARGQTLGVLMLVSLPHGPRFREEDLEYCWQLVDRVAATLDAVQLVNDVRTRERRHRLLAELTRQFSASLQLQKVLHTIVARVAETLADWCTIGLLDEHSELMEVAAIYHRDPAGHATLQRLTHERSIRIGEGLPGRVAASRTPIILDHGDPDTLLALAREHGDTDTILALRPSSYLCVPLMARGRILGYLDVACDEKSAHDLGPAELDFVQDLGDRAAAAIQNAQLYEELQRVLQAKDEWLTLASHELKTPLTPLQVLLQLMERRVQRDQPVTLEHLHRCLTQVGRVTELINDMLDVSKIERGQLELDLEPFAVGDLVKEVLEHFKGSSETHPLILNTGGEGLMMRGDRDRIEQVLTSLVHNAIKYSPEGGEVRVGLEVAQHLETTQVVISVEDQGIGIPEQEQPRLFTRYFRGSNASERNYGGLGLGLWISHAIVTRHGGRMWAESVPGEGSTFLVALPLLETN